VGGDSVVIALDGAEGMPEEERVANVRRHLDGLVAADAITGHPSGVSLQVRNASEAIPGLLRRLEGNSLSITGLQMSRPSLDDVFMQYTGRHIRTEAADNYIPLGW
jgi:ABC-2 type transport system ATP-binding protein